MPDIILRKAEEQDMVAIYNLVYELAVFEQEPQSVKVEVSDYLHAYREQLFDSFVAVVDDMIVGIALYYMTFSTWKGKCLYLEDFYVKPAFRKMGIGQKLFDAFIQEAKSLEAKQVKWQVLDWNTHALDFYTRNHAVIEKNWWNGKIYFE